MQFTCQNPRRVKVFKPRRFQFDPMFCRSCLHDIPTVFQHFPQIHGFFRKIHFPRIQFAHIQNIIDQRQQILRRHADLFMIFSYRLRIVQTFIRNIQHTDDTIHRRADIVGHSGQKFAFRLIRHFQFHILFMHLFRVKHHGTCNHNKCSQSGKQQHRLDRMHPYIASQRCFIQVHISFFQKCCFLQIRQAVNIVIHKPYKLQIAFSCDRNTDILCTSRDQAGNQCAVSIIHIIFQG